MEVDKEARCSRSQTAKFRSGKWMMSTARGYILGGLSDTLYDVYEINYTNSTAKKVWDDLDSKYKKEDAGNKKFLIIKLFEFRMKECRKELKQKKDAMTMQELVKYIQVEENFCNLDRLELEDHKSSKALVVDHGSFSGSKHKLDGQEFFENSFSRKWRNEDIINEDQVHPTPDKGFKKKEWIKYFDTCAPGNDTYRVI
ncbi:hypothetical protein RJ639_020914 [Escallonia herrerae]|uniref:Uncharacterized protein n=1 Tax=Escallonia herrerae TaxID=1293975 RepID=A0AA88V7L0_9ASTE|nr:hypothetical protein RJ639_020914 [Escallonia herrerae]